jgi:DNA-directed RNA polymerase specialized sigma54-like protein
LPQDFLLITGTKEKINNMKQTAVEWLVQELHDNGYFHEGVPEDIVKKAKEMEKQRIKNEREEAYNNGYANGQMDAFTN